MPRIRKAYNLGSYHIIQPLPALHKDELVEAWLSQLPDGQQVVLNILRIPYDELNREDRRAYATFQNEVEILKKSRHLNIISICRLHPQAVFLREELYFSKIDFQDESWWFWAMEHLQGESLASRMQQMRRLPLEEVAEIVYQVGSALDYIHSKGIVHLNVNPETIFFRYPLSSPNRRMELVLTDFSIATKADQQAVDGRMVEPKFKPYMAPERIKLPQVSSDQPLDNRPMDVYSLGVLFYHMLAGSLPFTGSDEDVERAILEAAPPPLQRFDVPPEIEEITFQALEKDPAKRPSVEEMMTSLDKSVPSPRVLGRRMEAPITEEAVSAEGTRPYTELGHSRILGVPTAEIPPPPPRSFLQRIAAPLLALRRPMPAIGKPGLYPAPRLLEPEDLAFIKGQATFTWDWRGELKDNEAFELRIWKKEEERHDRAGELQKEPALEVDLDALIPERSGEGDVCFWSVAVVQENPYRSLSKEAQSRSFTYGEPPAEEEAEMEKRIDVEAGE